jgi:hypothetical protein
MMRGTGGHRNCAMRGCGAGLRSGDIMRGICLCQTCRRRAARQLSALPRMYQACEQVLEFRRNHTAARTRVSGGRPEGIRLNEAAVELRSVMASVLRSWADVVTDHRSGPGPASPEIGPVACFLTTNLDWLAAHPAAADFAGEVAALVAAADKVLNPDDGRRVETGPLPRDRLRADDIRQRPDRTRGASAPGGLRRRPYLAGPSVAAAGLAARPHAASPPLTQRTHPDPTDPPP